MRGTNSLRAFWVSLSLATLVAAESRSADFGKYPVIQGATDKTTTQINIVTSRSERLSAVLIDGSRVIEPAAEKRAIRGSSQWAVLKLRFKGLSPGVSYKLELRDASGKLQDTRELKTLDTQKKSGRFVLYSCTSDGFAKDQKRMWDGVASHQADLIVSMGDSVYADRGAKKKGESSANKIWRRYAEHFEQFEIFRMKTLIPFVATWDDHDYGKNDGDSRFSLKKSAAETFRAFFAQEPVSGFLESGPGVSSLITVFGQRIFLMDNRTFRSPNDGSGTQTHWGAEQESWFVKKLNLAATPVWLVNGSQFFGGYMPFESYERNHPQSFKWLKEVLSKTQAPVIFASGDRHLSELMRIEPGVLGYETYEITSSGLLSHHNNKAWAIYPNPRKLAGNSRVHNYVIVDSVAPENGPLHAGLAAYGPKREILFKFDLTVNRLEPAKPILITQ